jgi:hypothetical protein
MCESFPSAQGKVCGTEVSQSKGVLPTMVRRQIAHNKPQRPRIGKRRLGEMIEAATVDSNSESE